MEKEVAEVNKMFGDQRLKTLAHSIKLSAWLDTTRTTLENVFFVI